VVEPDTPNAAVGLGDLHIAEQVACKRSDLKFGGLLGQTARAELREGLVALGGNGSDLVGAMNNVAEKTSATLVQGFAGLGIDQ
jgi:hypothetical protein